jgi:hypothetical protein
MLILAIAESFSGRNLRARIQGRRAGKPLAPIAVARLAALAKASSLGGAVFGGFGAGFLAYTLGSIDKAVPRSDAINAGATLAAATADQASDEPGRPRYTDRRRPAPAQPANRYARTGTS